MRQDDLNAFSEPLLIPRLSFRCFYIRAEDSTGNAFFPQDALEPRQYVSFPCIYGKDLASPSLGQFRSDLYQQFAFFCVREIFGQI